MAVSLETFLAQNRHFRARKECLLKWAQKEFPNVDTEEIELLIDYTFPEPLIPLQ